MHHPERRTSNGSQSIHINTVTMPQQWFCARNERRKVREGIPVIDTPAMTAQSLTTPIAFSKSTYRMEWTQPLGVNAAVVTVTMTGRCTSAHRGMDTCAKMTGNGHS
jgi:hypothetical protein